jgi:hypothetical protein
MMTRGTGAYWHSVYYSLYLGFAWFCKYKSSNTDTLEGEAAQDDAGVCVHIDD